MPFKTKKRKVSASSRHVLNFSNISTVSYANRAIKENNKEVNSVREKKNSSSIETNYGFVKNELVKITLLAVLIIGLQIALKYSHFSFLL